MKRDQDVSDLELFARRGTMGLVAAYSAGPIRRFVADVPLIILVPITAVIAMLTMPLGLLRAGAVFVARWQSSLHRDFSETFGQDSEEARQWEIRDRAEPVIVERDYDLVFTPPPGSFTNPDDSSKRPQFGRKAQS